MASILCSKEISKLFNLQRASKDTVKRLDNLCLAAESAMINANLIHRNLYKKSSRKTNSNREIKNTPKQNSKLQIQSLFNLDKRKTTKLKSSSRSRSKKHGKQ